MELGSRGIACLAFQQNIATLVTFHTENRFGAAGEKLTEKQKSAHASLASVPLASAVKVCSLLGC
jgi:hypothetical protein